MNITYVYVIAQFDNDELLFSENFKIGKADNLKQRFNQEYKKNTMCINPKYIRVIEKYKKHHVPDKPLLSFLDEYWEPLIVRKSKLRELCSFKGQEALDLFDDLVKLMPGIIKYYKDPDEIHELVERDSIIKDVVNNLVNNVISENFDIVSENSDTIQSIDIPDNIYDLLIKLVKTAYDPYKNKQPLKKYIGETYILTIIENIPDTEQFMRISEYPRENKEEILKILYITDKNIKEWAIYSDLLKKHIYTYPNCILGIIKKYVESQ